MLRVVPLTDQNFSSLAEVARGTPLRWCWCGYWRGRRVRLRAWGASHRGLPVVAESEEGDGAISAAGAFTGILPMFERAGFQVVAERASDPSSSHQRVVVRRNRWRWTGARPPG